MPRIQKYRSRTYNSNAGTPVQYFKYSVNIPERMMREAGLTAGMDLKIEAKAASLVLKPKEMAARV